MILKFWSVKILRFVVIFFIFSVVVASYFYPGGNIHDPSQEGYSIALNFLSDLGGYKSHSGEVNFISAFFFNMAMFLFLLVGISFIFIPRLFKENSLTHNLALIGSAFFFLGTIFFAAIGLTPHDLYRDMHIYFAINAFRLLIPGSIFYVIVLYRSSVPNKYTYITSFYLLSTFFYVFYQIFSGSPLESNQALREAALVQKFIVLISVISIFSLSYAFSSKLKENNILQYNL